jgi:hypothetical protein
LEREPKAPAFVPFSLSEGVWPGFYWVNTRHVLLLCLLLLLMETTETTGVLRLLVYCNPCPELGFTAADHTCLGLFASGVQGTF